MNRFIISALREHTRTVRTTADTIAYEQTACRHDEDKLRESDTKGVRVLRVCTECGLGELEMPVARGRFYVLRSFAGAGSVHTMPYSDMLPLVVGEPLDFLTEEKVDRFGSAFQALIRRRLEADLFLHEKLGAPIDHLWNFFPPYPGEYGSEEKGVTK